MEHVRVFEVANEFGTDTRTVIAVLSSLGEKRMTAESKLAGSIATRLRDTLADRLARQIPHRAVLSSHESRQQPRPERPNSGAGAWRDSQRQALLSTIPETYAALRASVDRASEIGVVVVFHDKSAKNPYGVSAISGEQCPAFQPGSAALQDALAPLRQAHVWYRERDKDAPNSYVAFDLAGGHAWFGRSLAVVQGQRNSPILDAETLTQIEVPTVPTTGEPPRLAMRAQHFTPDRVPSLRSKISDGIDRPEEAFLLHEDLLKLAVDSLDGADVLDPLPVHVNALWVFSRPIIMQRPDGSDRHVRAVWFRQGEIMWRIRTYAAGVGVKKVKQVGDQLVGRKPFVPVWDDTRPEQKLLAAIWALMSQGGVTESERLAKSDGTGDRSGTEPTSELTLVRVKAGTEHAVVYGPDGADGLSPRASWSVRGHWRHQPYLSLGRDEDGRIRTEPIWISSYVKGSGQTKLDVQKIISVRS